MRSKVLRRLFLLLVLGLCLWARYSSSLLEPGHPSRGQAGQAQQTKGEGRQLASPLAPGQPVQPVQEDQAWDQFNKRFGNQLEPAFSATGQLVSIKGSSTQKADAKKGLSPSLRFFRVDRTENVAARAQEILRAAEGLLEIDPNWPLQIAGVQRGPFSAQAYFQQTYQGLQVFPVGAVKVDLGSKGELLALSSDYAPRIQITNHEKLSLDEARTKAMERVLAEIEDATKRRSVRPEAGTKVVWVSQAEVAQIAYRFSIEGREVVVDAETGAILFHRDRRQF